MIVASISLLIPVIENVMLVNINGGTYEGVSAQTFHNKFVPFLSISLFIIGKYIYEFVGKHFNREKTLTKMMCNGVQIVSETTYGIYIIHIMVKDYPGIKEIPNNLIAAGLNGLIANLIYVAVVFWCSFVIVYIYQIAKMGIIKLVKGLSN